MAEAPRQRALADDLNRAIVNENDSWRGIYDGVEAPAWYLRLLTQLLLLIDDNEIKYLTSRVDYGESSFEFELLVFTETKVVTARGKGTTSDDVNAEVWAQGRSAISRVSISGGHGPYVHELGSTSWPGRVVIKVTLDDQELTLPAGRARSDALVGFLPSLLRGL
ncbi:hypothetical protein GCM10009840_18110 [Pseudolysinimonas kribbensis]|uniref:Uncharacterized protein n=1 Tax=Pseudolysinimonas kribbensis TaxID=433641 RepID=A0ABQ6JZQ7_9MICO|nr:hypothetical protein [Pseudolysinimonas kribbensis]GMA93806.1 hypothetical protein GCM10025881_06300 [Pseudolysinimonas kribbensis]